jgi:hypothetical protein
LASLPIAISASSTPPPSDHQSDGERFGSALRSFASTTARLARGGVAGLPAATTKGSKKTPENRTDRDDSMLFSAETLGL